MSFAATLAKTALEAAGRALLDLARSALRVRRKPSPPAEPSQPLSHRDVELQQEQIRSATTQRLRTIRPPPPPLPPRRKR